MAKTRYAPDRGLTARMTLTMFLLGVVFVAFITVLVLVLGATNRVSSGGIVFFAVLVGLALGVGSFWYSDKIALSTARGPGGHPAGRAAGGPAARHRGPAHRAGQHAQAPGRDRPVPDAERVRHRAEQKTAVLVVTTGLLNSNLDDRELEAVLAHELSHVAHKDVVVMTIASFIGIIAGLLVRFAFYSELFGGGGRGRGGNNNNGGALPVVLIVLVVGIVTYAVSFLLIRLLSRYRELAADRSGALLTGQPSALASALQKVSGSMNAIPTKDLRAAEPLNAFYFIPAFKASEKGSSA